MQNTWKWRWEAFKLRARAVRKGPEKAALSVELIKVDYHQDNQPPNHKLWCCKTPLESAVEASLHFPMETALPGKRLGPAQHHPLMNPQSR